MNILAIETSCDETALALVEAKGGLKKPQFKILKEFVATQIETHRPWGGVVPHLAKREHEKNLPLLFQRIKNQKSIIKNQVDRIAVTVGPGLEPCLWSGVNFAKQVWPQKNAEITRTNAEKGLLRPSAFSQRKSAPTLVGANHLEGHLYGFLLAKEAKIFNSQLPISKLFPAVQLVVSGGHTILVLMESLTKWRKLGETRDDAVGEAFDKVARMLKLPYPGGPEIERLAQKGDPEAINFPKPMINAKNYDFSFSGLKTSVLYYLRDHKKVRRADIAASFQKTVIDILVAKTIRAAREFDAKSIMVSGGVASNKALRKRLKTQSSKLKTSFFSAPPKYQTDNAVIIAIAAYINNLAGKKYKLRAQSNLNL